MDYFRIGLRKSTLLVMFLTVFSFLGFSNVYVKDHAVCVERSMCDDPSDYPDVDYMDEVSIEGEGVPWSGNIEIKNVTFMHNFSEKNS